MAFESKSTKPETGKRPRSELRGVALPTEHGGWGLTVEPGLLGLLVEPTTSGACLAAGALVAFLVRTPLKLALVDRRRGRRLPRTALAERVAALELLILVALILITIATAKSNNWWLPLLIALPAAAVGLAYDIRSRSRRLVPELAGATAIAAIAAAIVLAGGGDSRLAYGLWILLTARVITSIPHVRTQIARLHHRDLQDRLKGHLNGVADFGAVGLGVAATALDQTVLAGAVALVAIVGYQFVRRRQPVSPIKIVGISQMMLGLVLVLAAAAGVALAA